MLACWGKMTDAKRQQWNGFNVIHVICGLTKGVLISKNKQGGVYVHVDAAGTLIRFHCGESKN